MAAVSDDKPRVLVLGGTGFIGRNFVHHLVTNDLASKVRVADKVPPQMSWLNARHKETFDSPLVEFKHSNLINSGSVTSAFTDESGEYDYVINCAAETKYGQTEAVYKDGTVRLSMNCAREAEKRGVKFYIELSSGQMSSSEKKPASEDVKCEPWTHLAMHKLDVEHQLRSLTGLKYAIIRPGIVYGLGDKTGLTSRLIIGAIYKYTKQKMKMLWTKDLKMNTVHIEDLCRAIWFLLMQGKSGGVWNCVDAGDTTQGLISEKISEVFGIKYDFLGTIKSNLARVSMSQVVEDINDKHMRPWAEACNRDGIQITPLNPFIHQELLYNKYLNLDSTKLRKAGFTFQHPRLSTEILQEVLSDYVQMGLFPKSLLSAETLEMHNEEEEEEVEGEEEEVIEDNGIHGNGIDNKSAEIQNGITVKGDHSCSLKGDHSDELDALSEKLKNEKISEIVAQGDSEIAKST